MDTRLRSDAGNVSVWKSAFVSGFASAVALWVSWFVTHLPWIGLSEQVALPIVLGVWVLTFALTARRCPQGSPWASGAIGGVIAAMVGLLVLGSKLRPQNPAGGAVTDALHPSAGLIALGFVTLGCVVGLAGTALARVLAPTRCHLTQHERFAWVTVAAAAPLMFVGGLVTSTNSGMAVPDWPNTFGTNMFLYPLGPRVPANIYLEHSHRLFGTLVGCAALVLMIWTLRSTVRGYVKAWTVGVFVLIVGQGLLGAFRVLLDMRAGALIHGVIAQVIFAGLVGAAVYLSAGHAGARAEGPLDGARRLKALATAAMHSLILQLLLGAAYRHMRHKHILWTHAAFAAIVTLLAVVGAFVAIAFAEKHPTARWSPTVRLSATALVVAIVIQFVLGWIAFGFGGQQLQADSLVQTLIRTSHQANGAAVLGAVMALFLLARALVVGKARPSGA